VKVAKDGRARMIEERETRRENRNKDRSEKILRDHT